MKFITLSILLFTSSQSFSTDLDSKLAEEYALYAMMASNAYLDGERSYFPIERLGWIRVDQKARPTNKNSYSPKFLGKLFSNLQFDIWEHQYSNKTVISFKGSDEKIDWLTNLPPTPISVQYKSAKKKVKKYLKKHKNKREVILTGHSLGGGLALSVSLWLGLDAVVFNSTPRMYDGFGDRNKPANRIAIYQEGDVLQKLRKIYPKFYNLVSHTDKTKNIDVIQTNFEYENLSQHRADFLAEGILRCSKGNPEFQEIANSLPINIECDF